MEKASVIILNWNGERVLSACVDSVARTDYPDLGILVVDNGSRDGSCAWVRERHPRVELLALDRNYGFAGGMNRGLRRAYRQGSKHLVLLNNDCVVTDKDWLAKLVEPAEREGAVGVVGGIVVSMEGTITSAGSRVTDVGTPSLLQSPSWRIPEEPYDVEAVAGAVMLIERRVIDAIGLLDDGFFPGNFEDIDYCDRARHSGFRVVVAPSVRVRHEEGHSFKRLSESERDRAWKKNQVRYRILNAPFASFARFLLHDLGRLAAGLLGASPLACALAFAYGYGCAIGELPRLLWRRYHRGAKLLLEE